MEISDELRVYLEHRLKSLSFRMEWQEIAVEKRQRDRNRKQITRCKGYRELDGAKRGEWLKTYRGLLDLLNGAPLKPVTKENKPMVTFFFSAYHLIEKEYLSKMPTYEGRTFAHSYRQKIYRSIAKFMKEHDFCKERGRRGKWYLENDVRKVVSSILDKPELCKKFSRVESHYYRTYLEHPHLRPFIDHFSPILHESK